MPDPIIKKPFEHFNVVTYTGNGTARTISGVGFQPDFVWIKVRNTAGTHVLTDAVRGGNKQLFSNLTNAEGTATNKVTGFTSDGFTLGADDGSGTGDANYNGNTYVAWCWKANGAGSSNTAGSITSTVSANTSAGFSVVTYTGNGTGGATIGHGLGVAPSMVIVKRRDFADDWSCYHTSLGGTKYIDLNSTAAAGTSIVLWNNTNPSSTVVTLGTSNRINGSSATYVAYCFAEVAGYSKFGSYTGNGSTDGTMVVTGFRPKFVMVKRTDAVYGWFIEDSARDTYNEQNKHLRAEVSDAEVSGGWKLDTLSNGFKLRESGNAVNASGGTYIYMAFAENPYKYSLAR